MDDLDLDGKAPPGAAAALQLTDLSVAYALLTYFAFAVLVIGVAVQTMRMLRYVQRTPPDLGSGSLPRRLFRAGTDVLLLRSTFFADRWAWIFGAMFHFGLALTLLRHLRYFLDPSWVGPLWQLVELVQPFGFYGGLALPAGALCWWLRQIVLKQGRIVTDWADHAVMALLIAIPVMGYLNTSMHPDVVAVKAFAVGLVVFRWTNIPPDPLLLAHLWLVAALMIVMPFSRLLLLLPFGSMLHLRSTPDQATARSRARLVRAIGPLLVVALLLPVAVVARHAVKTGFQPVKADFARLVKEHRSADGTLMIRNHPAFLFSHRTIKVHSGNGSAGDSIERCVTCHAVKDAGGQPVGFASPTHFCRGCHIKAAVTIDCFECHTSKPVQEQQALWPPASRFAGLARHAEARHADERTAAR